MKRDIKADRKIGEYWEKQFCYMAAEFDFLFTANQIGRSKSAIASQKQNNGGYNSLTLPDIVVWTFPGQHHEIKHKNPTRGGAYGLEVYRLNALVSFAKETRQDVLYTIHNYDLAGGKQTKINNIDHWFTVNVMTLLSKTGNTPNTNYGSYINGSYKNNVPMWFWGIDIFNPLLDYWISCKETT